MFLLALICSPHEVHSERVHKLFRDGTRATKTELNEPKVRPSNMAKNERTGVDAAPNTDPVMKFSYRPATVQPWMEVVESVDSPRLKPLLQGFQVQCQSSRPIRDPSFPA